MKKFFDNTNGCKFSSKRAIKAVLIAFFMILSFVLFSCGPNTPPSPNIAPEMTKISIYRSIQANYSGSIMPVCLVLDNENKCESINIIIELNNPDKRTISQLTVNDVIYKTLAFSEESTSDRVVIENYIIDQHSGAFEIKVEKIYYQLPNEQKLIQNLQGNTIDILIAPIFNLTLDLSQGREHSGYEPIVERQNNYKSRLNLFLDADMQAVIDRGGEPTEAGYTFGKEGYTFGGWFDEPSGQGREYKATDYYTDNKNIKLYAYYGLTCNYSVIEGPESFATVTGLTKLGLTNNSVLILDEYEGVPVKEIAANSFKNMLGNKSVTIPESLVKIGQRAFDSAYSVTMDLKNVEIIDDFAFSSCQTLNIQYLPNSLTNIGASAFMGCTWKTKIYNPNSNSLYFENANTLIIPDTVKSIGEGAFKNSRFKEVYFWEKGMLEEFGAEVFSNNKTLSTIWTSTSFYAETGALKRSTETGIKTIGDRWFFECTSLIIDKASQSNSYFAEGLEIIGDRAFASGGLGSQAGLTKVVSLTFPSSLKKIGMQAFVNTKLNEVLFTKESQFEELGDRAFQTTNLRTVAFYSLKKFGPAPFMASPIEYIEFDLGSDSAVVEYVPHSPILIDKSGFSIGNGFSRFAKIYVPENKVSEYNDYSSSGWWKDTKGKYEDWQPILAMESIVEVQGSGGARISYEETVDGGIRLTNIFRKGSESMQHIVVEPSYDNKPVTEIGSFVACDDSLLTVTLPDTVKIIAKSAFRDAKNLTEIKWRNGTKLLSDINNISLEKIEDYAFAGSSLLKFESTNSLNYIGAKAFASCSLMRSVALIYGPKDELGKGLLEIQSLAFRYCGEDLSLDTTLSLVIDAEIIKKMGEDGLQGVLGSVFSLSKLEYIYIRTPGSLSPEYKFPIPYYTFGNSFTITPKIYFSTENFYQLFLVGKTNQYFDLGFCPWTEDNSPDIDKRTIVYEKGVTVP